MPAALGTSSSALVAGVCDMLDVAGTVGDGDQDAGRYWLHKFSEQQLASQRLNEIPEPSPWAVILAHAVLLLQWSHLKQSLTPINVPFINSIVAAKHLWETKTSSVQHKVINKKKQREAHKQFPLKPRQICVPTGVKHILFFAIHYFWVGRYDGAN